jgi:pimeloyl-ACP methyl ester carboxylesterase
MSYRKTARRGGRGPRLHHGIHFIVIVFLLLNARFALAGASVARTDFYAQEAGGIRIHVREVRAGHGKCEPIVLLHGARVPGVASFDLPVPGGSLAADFAARGLCAYVVDLRGYGSSTRPVEMDKPPEKRVPLVHSVEAAQDLDAAVDLVRKRSRAARVSLFGWATGGQWAGLYATLHPEKLSHLILLNSLYGADAPHPLMGHGSNMEDPSHPGHLNPAIGAYGCNTADSLLGVWNRSIPLEDKHAWRDPAVVDAYVREALASDPETGKHTPPCFRSPNGAMEDSFYLATGRQLWDASLIYTPTLFLASERDFWSRAADRDKLQEHLVHASLRILVIPGATHFVHLDRDERGRRVLMEEVMKFVGAETQGAGK